MSAVVTPDLLESAETLEALDFTPECEAATVSFIRIFARLIPVAAEPCTRAAAYLCTCRRCGDVSNMCLEHRDAIAQQDNGECNECGAIGPTAEIFAFTPIRGRG